MDQLWAGRYRPRPVRQVTILKSDGGERELGLQAFPLGFITFRLRVCRLVHAVRPKLRPAPEPLEPGDLLGQRGVLQFQRRVLLA